MRKLLILLLPLLIGAQDVSVLGAGGGISSASNISQHAIIGQPTPVTVSTNSEVILSSGAMYGLSDLYTGPVWFVSTAGSDETGDGSEFSPFASIHFAVQQTVSGDTVVLGSGEYFENVNFNHDTLTFLGDTIIASIVNGGNVESCFIIDSSSVNLFDISFTNGSVQTWPKNGSGVRYYKSIGQIERCKFYGNHSSAEGSGAGGVGITYSTVNIKNSEVYDNSAIDIGGGISYVWSSGYVRSSKIVSNTASGSLERGGGGLAIWHSNVDVLHTLITNNTAEYGGGIWIRNISNLNVTNSTITQNTALARAGGISRFDPYDNSINVENSIVWGNSAPSNPDHTISDSDINYSIIQTLGGIGNNYIDPLLTPEFKLTSNSPAIDMGNPDLDGDGDQWVLDLDDQDPDGTRLDIGAYYYQQSYFGPTWYVSNDGSDSLGNGSEEFPLSTIQLAINRAGLTDSIIVEPGLYIENIFLLDKHLSLCSRFIDDADTSIISNTIIDGNDDTHVIRAQDSRITIIGLTIRNGYEQFGGGINAVSDDLLSIQNCIISNNISTINGGAIYHNQGSLELLNTQIINNESYERGGGITIMGDSVSIINCQMSGNIANNAAGAVYHQNSYLDIRGSIFRSNSVVGVGGGIYAQGGELSITASTFEYNSSISAHAGAIYLGVSATFDSLIFNSNSAQEWGGALQVENGNTSILHSLFFNNTAGLEGQAISLGETAGLDLQFCTFGTNGTSPGSIALYEDSYLELSNSILWGNQGAQIRVLESLNPCTIEISYCDIENGTESIDDQSGFLSLIWGEGNFDIIPQFEPDGGFSLSLISPCIDAGNPDNDDDGDSWEIDPDDQDPDGTRFDMGAYYFQRPTYEGPVWHVSIDGSDDTGNGSEEDPFATIEWALNMASSGDTVSIGPGTYSSEILIDNLSVVVAGTDSSNTFIIPPSPILVQSDTTNHVLFSNLQILGNGGGTSLLTYTECNDCDLNDTLYVTLVNIRVNGNSGSKFLDLFKNVVVEAQSCSFVNLEAGGGDGAAFQIRNDGGITGQRLSVFNSEFVDNSANRGGSISCETEAEVYILNSIFDANHVDAQSGGAICLSQNSQGVITQSSFYSNVSDNYGGAIAVYSGSIVLIASCKFSGNSANYTGGAIYSEYADSISVINSSFVNNHANTSGGAIQFAASNEGNVESCIFDANYSTSGGGVAISGNENDLSISHSLITYNDAEAYGGGIYCNATSSANSIVTLTNNTFVSNTALSSGGGIYIVRYVDLNVNNCIVWGNSAEQIDINTPGDCNVSVNYSDIGDGYPGVGNIELDPMFLTDSSTLFHLTSGSPCIDAGNPDLDGDSYTWVTDIDDQDPDGTRMDMGAYYYHQVPSYEGPVWHVSSEGSDDVGDGSISSPFRTIQQGVNQAGQNDTILIGSGTFSDLINVQSKSLFILGVDSTETVIAADYVYTQSHLQGQVVSFQRLKFESNGTGNDYMVWAECTGCSEEDSAQIQFVDVLADGANEKGFLLVSRQAKVLVSNSQFFRCGASSWDGAVFNLNKSSAEIDHTIFANNSTGENGQVLYATSGSSVKINFSSLSGNGINPGSVALSDGSELVLSNSILWGTPNFQIVILDDGEVSSVNISYCDISNGQFGIDDQSSTLDLVWGPGNLDVTPEFISPSDLNLQAFSPCIDSGNPDLDTDGDVWSIDTDDQDPDGTRFDMGAYFYDQTDSIAPEVSLNFPEITEVPHNGDTLQVTWEASDNNSLDWAKLWFSSDGGQSFILSDSLDANRGQVDWVAPDVISNSCKLAIWVSDVTGNVSADTLDGTFPIADGTLPTITILTPALSSAIPEGDTLYVEWEANDNVGIEWFDLYYYNDPSSIETGIFNIPASERSFAFEIPRPGVSDSAQIRIDVMDLASNINYDYSEYFSITDNSNPIISHFSIPDTSAFGIGGMMDIQISATDNVQVTGLDLNYTIDAGATWIPIVQGLFPVTGRPTYSWIIPDIPGDCQIQAIVTDAVTLTDTSYSEMFSVVIEYPILWANQPQIKPNMDMHLYFSQSMATGVSTGIQVIGTVGGTYEVVAEISGPDVTISTVSGFVSLDTLMLVLSASEWTNAFGYGLDGNGNGLYEGSPMDNDTSYTFVSAAGDYDQNSILDFEDFNAFVIAWYDNDTDNELAPHLGEIPFISIQPDSSFDIFDLATFASMWNWSAGVFQISPQIDNYDVASMVANQNGNNLSVRLETSEFIASQTIIKYDPNIVDVSVSDPGLAKVSTESMVFVDANPDSGYITITSSNLSGVIEDQLALELTPRTKHRYSIEVAIQGSDADGNVTQKRTSIDLIPIPTSYRLSQNYPNPFNASTMIEYGLPRNSELNISIFDIQGRFVKEIHSGPKQAGYHAIQWNGLNDNGQGVASGVYFIVLNTPEYRVARKALILK